MTDRPRPSKWVLALARWAVLFGLIGVGAVLSAWLRGAHATTQGANALLFVGTAFLALAFVLAPFVRNAFGLPSFSQRRVRGNYRTTLDEMREGAPADAAQMDPTPPAKLTAGARLVIALYLVFAGVLVAALVAM